MTDLPQIAPMLSYEEVSEAADWLVRAFGFEEWVQVDDVDAHFEHASEAGATLLSEIEDGPDGRLYRVEDPEGHRWMFAQAG